MKQNTFMNTCDAVLKQNHRPFCIICYSRFVAQVWKLQGFPTQPSPGYGEASIETFVRLARYVYDINGLFREGSYGAYQNFHTLEFTFIKGEERFRRCSRGMLVASFRSLRGAAFRPLRGSNILYATFMGSVWTVLLNGEQRRRIGSNKGHKS